MKGTGSSNEKLSSGMGPATLGERSVALIDAIAGLYADRFVSERLIPRARKVLKTEHSNVPSVRAKLQDGQKAFALVLAEYGVARKNPVGEDLVPLVLEAIDLTLGGEQFSELLASGDSGALWESFQEITQSKEKKDPVENLQHLFEGFLELNCEIFRDQGEESIFCWIANEIKTTHRVDYIFERLTEIRNLGPKAASLLLRDTTFYFDCEDSVHYSDRPYLQPVSSALRRIGPLIVPELSEGKLADWILAGKVAKYVRLSGRSGVRFSMGVSFFIHVEPFALEPLIQTYCNN